MKSFTVHVLPDMPEALPDRRNGPEIVAWLGRPDLAASISSYWKAMQSSPGAASRTATLPVAPDIRGCSVEERP